MNMTEAALSVFLLVVVLGGFVAMRTDFALDGDAKRVAAVVVDLQEAAERYLDDRYSVIEQCLRGEEWGREWRDKTTSGTVPENAGPFIAVPLYGGADTGYLGARSPSGTLAANPIVNCLPSLAGAGMLPAGLAGLRHAGGLPANREHLYNDRYDFRLLARLAQLDPDPGALEPVIGVQMLLVLKTELRDPLPYAFVQRVAEATGLPEVGIVGSIAPADGTAEQTIEGAAGSWRLELCRGSGAPVYIAAAACVPGTGTISNPLDQRRI